MNRYFFFILVISYAFAATYSASISDLSSNFTSVNGGVFHVNDSVVVSTSFHNLAQLTTRTCTSSGGSFLSGGLQCCNVSSSATCTCPNSMFTLTFSTAGTYFFECAIPGHCSGSFMLLGQITFSNPIIASSSHHNATSSHHNATSSQHNATSSHNNATSSHHNATSSHKNTTSSHKNTTSSHHNNTTSSHYNGVTYRATIFDLANNFANINGGIFYVNDKIIVNTTGGHNIAQITTKVCGSAFVTGGLQCCDVGTNNNCQCPNNTYTLTFSTAGTYFFECAVSGHCTNLGLLGKLTILSSSSSHPSGAERLTSALSLLFVTSFILFVKFFKIF